MTPIQFAEMLLSRLSLPLSDNNVQALVAVQKIEGGHNNTAWFNPMNTTWKSPGSHDFTTQNKIGVQAFTDWEQGLDATAKTLTNGLYKNILSSLAANAPPDETLRQWGLSKWGWTSPVAKASSYQYYGNQQFIDRGGESRFLSLPGRALRGIEEAFSGKSAGLVTLAVGVSAALIVAIAVSELADRRRG